MLAFSRSLASWAQPLPKKLYKQRRLRIFRRRLRQRLRSRLTPIISNRYMRKAPPDAFTEICTKLLTRQTCCYMFWTHETRLVRSARAYWNAYERKRLISKLYWSLTSAICYRVRSRYVILPIMHSYETSDLMTGTTYPIPHAAIPNNCIPCFAKPFIRKGFAHSVAASVFPATLG